MNTLVKLKEEHLLELSRIIISALPADTCESILKDKQEMVAKFEFRTNAELQKMVRFKKYTN